MGELVGELHREPRLVGLEADRARRSLALRDVEVLRELLGERRPALGHATGLDVLDEGARDALPVDRAVLPEALVLDRDGRVLHQPVDLVERHGLAVLEARDARDQLVDARLLRAVALVDLGVLAERHGRHVRELVERADVGGRGGERDRDEAYDRAEDDGERQPEPRLAAAAARSRADPVALVGAGAHQLVVEFAHRSTTVMSTPRSCRSLARSPGSCVSAKHGIAGSMQGVSSRRRILPQCVPSSRS